MLENTGLKSRKTVTGLGGSTAGAVGAVALAPELAAINPILAAVFALVATIGPSLITSWQQYRLDLEAIRVQRDTAFGRLPAYTPPQTQPVPLPDPTRGGAQ